MILLVDNYDSFSYNLYQLIGAVQPDIKVVRNDELTVAEIEQLQPEKIVLSPGPGRPEQAGVCMEIVQHFAGQIPILGVCLGHQAICAAYGGAIVHAQRQMHGKQSEIKVNKDSVLFAQLPEQITVARYHSLAVDPETMPAELEVTAVTAAGEVMAVQHRTLPVYGLQFHPESILTPEGQTMIDNFLMIKTRRAQ